MSDHIDPKSPAEMYRALEAKLHEAEETARWAQSELALARQAKQGAEARLEGRTCRFVRVSGSSFFAVDHIRSISVTKNFGTEITTKDTVTFDVEEPYAEDVRNLLP